MENETRRKMNALAKWSSKEYDFNNIIRNDELYKMIIKNDADNFLISESEIDEHWIYFKQLHRMWSTGYHPADVRNFNGDYDF